MSEEEINLIDILNILEEKDFNVNLTTEEYRKDVIKAVELLLKRNKKLEQIENKLKEKNIPIETLLADMSKYYAVFVKEMLEELLEE